MMVTMMMMMTVMMMMVMMIIVMMITILGTSTIVFSLLRQPFVHDLAKRYGPTDQRTDAQCNLECH